MCLPASPSQCHWNNPGGIKSTISWPQQDRKKRSRVHIYIYIYTHMYIYVYVYRRTVPHGIFCVYVSTEVLMTSSIMMTSSNGNISALLAICAGNSPVTGEFPPQRPVTRSFDVSLIYAWIYGWVNNGEAGDLWRHRAHYDVTVMTKFTEPLLVHWELFRYRFACKIIVSNSISEVDAIVH